MGWIFDRGNEWDCDHEGYFVGVVREHEWRELGLADIDRGEIPLTWVQVACDCGWRTQRLVAPVGTTWAPCSVNIGGLGDAMTASQRDDWEEAGRALWTAHMATINGKDALGDTRWAIAMDWTIQRNKVTPSFGE